MKIDTEIDPISQKTIQFNVLEINNQLIAVVAQLAEHWLPKPRVAGSSPVYRSNVIDTSKINGKGK